MPIDLSPEIQAAAQEAAAPMLLAGALDAPKVDAAKVKAALTKLGLPTSGKALVIVAYDGCGTHDFPTLEKAAKQNNATLYVVYGNLNDPAATQKNKEKLSIGVTEHGKPRQLNAHIVLPPNVSAEEIATLANSIGLSVRSGAGGISSLGSALYEDGALKGIIPNRETQVTSSQKTASLPAKRSALILG